LTKRSLLGAGWEIPPVVRHMIYYSQVQERKLNLRDDSKRQLDYCCDPHKRADCSDCSPQSIKLPPVKFSSKIF
jgi:hypothetical protein